MLIFCRLTLGWVGSGHDYAVGWVSNLVGWVLKIGPNTMSDIYACAKCKVCAFNIVIFDTSHVCE